MNDQIISVKSELTKETPEETKRRLTIKQRRWLKKYLECGNASEAAFQVYECKDRVSAAQIGYENLRKLDYSDFLEEAGISDHLLQTKILEGLDANKPIGALVLIKNDKDGKPEQILKDNEGMIEVPDHLVRHKYLETALKLKKRLADKSGSAIGVSVKDGDKEIRVIVEDFV